MNVAVSVPREALAAIADPAGLEAALVLRRNGQVVAAWTRKPAPPDVVSVMSATLFGSAETLLETLGKASPPDILLETAAARVLLHRVGSGTVVMVAGPAGVPEARLREAAARVAALLPRPDPGASKRG